MTNRTAETVTITTRPCMFCRRTSDVELTPEQATAVEARTPIQATVARRCASHPRAADFRHAPELLGRGVRMTRQCHDGGNSTDSTNRAVITGKGQDTMGDMIDKELVVYSKPRCVQCTATYRALDNGGIPYRIVDLSENPLLSTSRSWVTNKHRLSSSTTRTTGPASDLTRSNESASSFRLDATQR